MRKALENRTNMEDDRVSILEAQLTQAKLIAEESDRKYMEVETSLRRNNFFFINFILIFLDSWWWILVRKENEKEITIVEKRVKERTEFHVVVLVSDHSVASSSLLFELHFNCQHEF